MMSASVSPRTSPGPRRSRAPLRAASSPRLRRSRAPLRAASSPRLRRSRDPVPSARSSRLRRSRRGSRRTCGLLSCGARAYLALAARGEKPPAPAGRVSTAGRYGRGVTTLVWRGRRVAWQRTGSGPPVVLCHGTPFSSAIWRPFADALGRDHTVYVWDMPGYGASSKTAGHAVDLGVQGELLADLIAEWGLDRPHVIAHDLGGAVSLRAHLLHGADYRSLMLVDVVAIPPTGSPFFRFVQAHPGLLAELPPYIHEAIVTAYIRGASHRGLRAEDLDALAAPCLTADGQPAFYRQIEQFDERYLEELQARWGEIDIPVRI